MSLASIPSLSRFAVPIMPKQESSKPMDPLRRMEPLPPLDAPAPLGIPALPAKAEPPATAQPFDSEADEPA